MGTVPIPGVKTVKQAQENLGSLGWRLSTDELLQLEYAARESPRQMIQNVFQTRWITEYSIAVPNNFRRIKILTMSMYVFERHEQLTQAFISNLTDEFEKQWTLIYLQRHINTLDIYATHRPYTLNQAYV